MNRVLSEMGRAREVGGDDLHRKALDISVTGSKEALLGPGFDSNGL